MTQTHPHPSQQAEVLSYKEMGAVFQNSQNIQDNLFNTGNQVQENLLKGILKVSYS